MDSSILKTAGPVSPTAMLFKCDMLIIGAERSYEGMMPATVIRQLWPHSFLVSPEVLLLQSAGVHEAHPSTFTELRFGLAHKKLLRPGRFHRISCRTWKTLTLGQHSSDGIRTCNRSISKLALQLTALLGRTRIFSRIFHVFFKNLTT